jgi:hypothetical protein
MIREYIIIGLAIVGGLILTIWTYPKNDVVISCSIAEISPDFTQEMREKCRQLRSVK